MRKGYCFANPCKESWMKDNENILSIMLIIVGITIYVQTNRISTKYYLSLQMIWLFNMLSFGLLTIIMIVSYEINQRYFVLNSIEKKHYWLVF